MLNKKRILSVAALIVLLASVLGWFAFQNKSAITDQLKLGTRIYSSNLPDEIVLFEPSLAAKSFPLEGIVGKRAVGVSYALVDADSTTAPQQWQPLEITGAYPASFSGSFIVPKEPAMLFLKSHRGKSHRPNAPTEIRPALIFIVAGQSNAAGASKHLFFSDSGNAFFADILESSIQWRSADDPGIPYGGGSVWPLVGDQLQESRGTAIGFVNVAVGSTNITQWQPGTAIFERLVDTLTRVQPFGITAVLWHQGEADQNTPQEDYRRKLENLISSANQQSGMTELPWLISTASFQRDETFEAIRQAQGEVVAASAHVFAGPDTDPLGLEFRESDEVHFNREGTIAAAKLWVDQIEAFLSSTH